MRNFVMFIVLGLLLTSLSACNQEAIANRGFSLPDGDVENGQLLFVDYHCNGCHSIAGTEFSDDEWRLTENGGINVVLGGEKTSIQSYGDLVTSIINPSHRLARGYPIDEISEDGESKMEYYNEVMTVAELIDLVTYLKTTYSIKPSPRTHYPHYVYPY